MSYYCYIIYSPSLNKFYVGQTQDFTQRLQMHNAGLSRFTSRAKDWKLDLLIPCNDKAQALKIERHIKSMKSIKYIRDLKRYPEMAENLITKFQSNRSVGYPGGRQD